ncbi:hypothetical protein I7I53_04226 [Histoplasma capsulatum var. duboisii H88]|uniref:Uncharacterized protein n=1 Tax=Ajellomyces capsulatus (strain H88) TaxID=544711 RepID=A0A8A1LQ16_AJEC8|nr:hypothetical protein I7I53_04226 [Histoplasma capsulatum var. duboisii H88]
MLIIQPRRMGDNCTGITGDRASALVRPFQTQITKVVLSVNSCEPCIFSVGVSNTVRFKNFLL